MGEYREVFRRKEIKYLLGKEQYTELMKYMDTIAVVDSYGISKINNIYYDTKDYRLIRNSLEKPVYKEKLRLRTYGDTSDDTNAFIEIKKKYNGIVYKRRIAGRYVTMHDYLAGKKTDIDPSQILREITSFIDLYGDLRPAMSVCYERMAMEGRTDREFRVTFDRNIEWNAMCSDLRDLRPGRMLLQPGQYLMEIKVGNALPVELSRRMSELGIFPASFSKYGAGYMDMIKTATVPAGSPARKRAVAGSRMKGEVAYV